jgi:hypothetical protein
MTQGRTNEDIVNSGWKQPNENLWPEVGSSIFTGLPDHEFLFVKNEQQNRILGAVRKGELGKDVEINSMDFLIKKGFLKFQVAHKISEKKYLEEVKIDPELPAGIEKIVYFKYSVSGEEFDHINDTIKFNERLNEIEIFNKKTKRQLIEDVIDLCNSLKAEAEYYFKCAEQYKGEERGERHLERGNRLIEYIKNISRN